MGTADILWARRQADVCFGRCVVKRITYSFQLFVFKKDTKNAMKFIRCVSKVNNFNIITDVSYTRIRVENGNLPMPDGDYNMLLFTNNNNTELTLAEYMQTSPPANIVKMIYKQLMVVCHQFNNTKMLDIAAKDIYLTEVTADALLIDSGGMRYVDVDTYCIKFCVRFLNGGIHRVGTNWWTVSLGLMKECERVQLNDIDFLKLERHVHVTCLQKAQERALKQMLKNGEHILRTMDNQNISPSYGKEVGIERGFGVLPFSYVIQMPMFRNVFREHKYDDKIIIRFEDGRALRQLVDEPQAMVIDNVEKDQDTFANSFLKTCYNFKYVLQ